MSTPDSFDSPAGRTYSTPETAGQAAAGDVLASLPRQWDAEADATAHWGDVTPPERAAYANGLRDCASELRKTLAAIAAAAPAAACPDPSQHRDVYGNPLPLADTGAAAPAPPLDGDAAAVEAAQRAYEAYVMAAPDDLEFPEWEQLPGWQQDAMIAGAQEAYEFRAGHVAAAAPAPAGDGETVSDREQVPAGIIPMDGELTEEQVAQLREDFDRAVKGTPRPPTEAEILAWIETHPREFNTWLRKYDRIHGTVATHPPAWWQRQWRLRGGI